MVGCALFVDWFVGLGMGGVVCCLVNAFDRLFCVITIVRVGWVCCFCLLCICYGLVVLFVCSVLFGGCLLVDWVCGCTI